MTWWNRLLRQKANGRELEKELRFHLDQHANELIARGIRAREAQRERPNRSGWPRASEGSMPRRPGHALAGRSPARLPLRAANTTPTARIRRSHIEHSRSGHWRDHGDVHRPQRSAAQAAARIRSQSVWSPCRARPKNTAISLGVSYPNYLDSRRPAAPLQPMGAWSYGGGTISSTGRRRVCAMAAKSRPICSMSSAFLFRAVALSGPKKTGLARRPSLSSAPPCGIGAMPVDRAAIGSPLVFDGKPYTIVGIAPAGFQLDGEADVFTPLGQVTEMTNAESRGIFHSGRGASARRRNPGHKLKLGSRSSAAILRNNTRKRIPDSTFKPHASSRGRGRRCSFNAVAAAGRRRAGAVNRLRQCGEPAFSARRFART